MTKITKYHLGWIGLRCSRIGTAGKLLKKAGWMKLDHADQHNRDGFDWVLPARRKHQFLEHDWRGLAHDGLVGIAIWFSDAQWAFNSGITDWQWQNRSIIEADFNRKWPTGRRHENP